MLAEYKVTSHRFELPVFNPDGTPHRTSNGRLVMAVSGFRGEVIELAAADAAPHVRSGVLVLHAREPEPQVDEDGD